MSAALLAGFTPALALALASPDPAKARSADEHGPAWLDENSPRTLKWVAEQREKTLATLRAKPDFATFEREAGTVLTDPTRIEDPRFVGDDVYQYWQDREHPLGQWRKSPKAAWLAGAPAWTTVIDLDALSAAEGKKWIFAGANCRGAHCLVNLSVNGKDASEAREFDLATGKFVNGGFVVHDSKSRSWWYDDDTLLVAPVLGRDSLNDHLLPKTVRVWKRGTPLKSAKPIFSIDDRDAMLSIQFIRAAGTDAFIAARHIDFETREYRLMTLDGQSRPLPLPRVASTLGVHDGKLLLRPNVAWRPEGGDREFAAGTVVAISLDALMKEGRIANAELVFTPSGDDSVRSIATGDGRLFVELLHDYFSRIAEVTRTPEGAWTARTLPLPSDRFLSTLGWEQGKLLLREEAPLVPDRVVLADPATGADAVLYQRAPQFDASNLVQELNRTASRDGTVIDYLVMHRRDMKLDGSNPTLVYGYGGYDVAITPRYEPIFGKLWLERGGVYVHAYLRGGGEHGAPWHRGAMRKNRQQPFDDMAAVLTDLQRRKITTPAHSGIMGRSNGGLMVAAVMEQKPELLNAVVVGGPLIDMLNFHELAPGGTWTAEYGDPRDPDMNAFLRSYSPMQNIAVSGVKYPVPLIITATDDDRVLPGHARRFAARLADKGHESLYFEDQQGGHYWELAGGPAPGDWRLRATARAVEFTYLWDRLSPVSPLKITSGILE